MKYKTEDGVEVTTDCIAESVDEFLSETDRLFVFDAEGNRYMASAKITFVSVD